MLSDNNTNADAASDCESPLSGNIVVFVSSLVWTLCYGFQLSRSLATDEVPSIMEFTRRKPVVGVISSRICDSSRITALKQGSMWAIGDGVFCPNSGLRLPCLCRLLMVSALMTTLSASVFFNFAAAMIRCMAGSVWNSTLVMWMKGITVLLCSICNRQSDSLFQITTLRHCAPFWTPEDDDGWWFYRTSYRRFCSCFLIIVSYQECNFITSRRIVLKVKEA